MSETDLRLSITITPLGHILPLLQTAFSKGIANVRRGTFWMEISATGILSNSNNRRSNKNKNKNLNLNLSHSHNLQQNQTRMKKMMNNKRRKNRNKINRNNKVEEEFLHLTINKNLTKITKILIPLKPQIMIIHQQIMMMEQFLIMFNPNSLDSSMISMIMLQKWSGKLLVAS